MTSRQYMRRDRGFTLIEVLMVILIVGILAGVAIQAFANTRGKAFDARAIHDLANAVRAQEAAYTTDGSYVTLAVTGPATLAHPGMVVSATITLTLKATEDGDSFVGTAVSSRGTGKVFEYDSSTGLFTS